MDHSKTTTKRSIRAPGLTPQQRARLYAETLCTEVTIAAVYAARPTKPVSYARIHDAAERLGLPLPPAHVRSAR